MGFPAKAGAIDPAEHDSCGLSSTCVIDLGDGRIASAPVLQTGNDMKHYLLTAFHASDQPDNTAQALYFMGQNESFAQSAQWNLRFIGGRGWWSAYPTMTMDKDLDTTFTFTTFQPGSTIYPNWYKCRAADISAALFDSINLKGLVAIVFLLAPVSEG